jgi:hypothetical protein
VSDHLVPQDRPPLDDAQRRDLAEKVGYGSATYWPATWRHGDQPYRHYWRVLYPHYADPKSTAHWYGKWKTSECAWGFSAKGSGPATSGSPVAPVVAARKPTRLRL